MSNNNNNNPNNDLNQFSDGQEGMIEALAEIGKTDRVQVRHANFESKQIIISIEGEDTSFDGVMSAVNFCRMTDRMMVRAVDFDTGEITIEWLESNEKKLELVCGLSKKEIDYMQAGRTIWAIKAHRERTGQGLADSKNAVENGWKIIKYNLGNRV